MLCGEADAILLSVGETTQQRRLTPAEQVRYVQVLTSKPNVKESYIREFIGYRAKQRAGPQHSRGWPGIMAAVFGVSRQHAHTRVKAANGVPPELIASFAGGKQNTLANLHRLRTKIVDEGVAPWDAFEAVVTRGEGRATRKRRGADAGVADKLAREDAAALREIGRGVPNRFAP